MTNTSVTHRAVVKHNDREYILDNMNIMQLHHLEADIRFEINMLEDVVASIRSKLVSKVADLIQKTNISKEADTRCDVPVDHAEPYVKMARPMRDDF